MFEKKAGSTAYSQALKNQKHKAIDIAIMVGPHGDDEAKNHGKESPNHPNESMSDETDELAPSVPMKDKFGKPTLQVREQGEPSADGDDSELAKRILDAQGDSHDQPDIPKPGLHNRVRSKMRGLIHK